MKKDFTIEKDQQEEIFDIDCEISSEIGSMLERTYALGYLVGQKDGHKSGYENGFREATTAANNLFKPRLIVDAEDEFEEDDEE